MRSTSFLLGQRAAVWVTRSAHSSLDWDLAASIFKLAKQRFVQYLVHNSYICIIILTYGLGIHEGETEAGSAGRAGGQSASKDNHHSEVDSGKDSQMSIPSRQKISYCNPSMYLP